jgi:hypothetical protein
MEGAGGAAQHLQTLLGLSDEELIRTLDASALELLGGELDHRPELPILLALLAEAEERAGATMLHRWVRTGNPRPVDLLTARDFPGFEDAVEDLAAKGYVLRVTSRGSSG